jgi:hypothetical protein
MLLSISDSFSARSTKGIEDGLRPHVELLRNEDDRTSKL